MSKKDQQLIHDLNISTYLVDSALCNDYMKFKKLLFAVSPIVDFSDTRCPITWEEFKKIILAESYDPTYIKENSQNNFINFLNAFDVFDTTYSQPAERYSVTSPQVHNPDNVNPFTIDKEWHNERNQVIDEDSIFWLRTRGDTNQFEEAMLEVIQQNAKIFDCLRLSNVDLKIPYIFLYNEKKQQLAIIKEEENINLLHRCINTNLHNKTEYDSLHKAHESVKQYAKHSENYTMRFSNGFDKWAAKEAQKNKEYQSKPELSWQICNYLQVNGYMEYRYTGERPPTYNWKRSKEVLYYFLGNFNQYEGNTTWKHANQFFIEDVAIDVRKAQKAFSALLKADKNIPATDKEFIDNLIGNKNEKIMGILDKIKRTKEAGITDIIKDLDKGITISTDAILQAVKALKLNDILSEKDFYDAIQAKDN